MVMGGDSCSKGRGFDSQHRMLDGQIFTFIHCKNILFEKTKINEKRPGMAHLKKQYLFTGVPLIGLMFYSSKYATLVRTIAALLK